MRICVALAAISLLVGCVNPGVVQVSQDRYVITRTDKAGIFGNASAMKADVIQDASDFAAAKGMQAVPISVKESPLQVGRSFASITYEFKLVDKSGSDPALTAIKEKCASDFQNNLALDPIRQYIPEFVEDTTLSQRASTKKPTSVEKGSIEILDQVQTSCRKNLREYYSKNGAPPDVLSAMSKNMNLQRDLLMELWAGRLTYGQYAIKRIAVVEQYRNQYTSIMNTERDRADALAVSQAKLSIAEQEAQVRAGAAQQAADAQSSMAATQRMMLINQQQQAQQQRIQPSTQAVNPAGTASNPVQTNCTKMGDSVNCRTYSY